MICSIENVDPMGVHTGDSITVAPQMTLTDREYQAMRDDALACIRAIGVETGGSNIQFAVDPATGRRVLIEMNPRVSRSSALASKATGFPIAKIAALLAVGYTLDEIPNDITGETLAAFEPALDYVVVKIPRFAFEKFADADPVLTSTMKSVGEVMAIGRTFAEALGQGLAVARDGRRGPGRALAGSGSPPRRTSRFRARGGSTSSRLRCKPVHRSTRWPRRRGSIPGSWTRSRGWSRRSARSAGARSTSWTPTTCARRSGRGCRTGGSPS